MITNMTTEGYRRALWAAEKLSKRQGSEVKLSKVLEDAMLEYIQHHLLDELMEEG